MIELQVAESHTREDGALAYTVVVKSDTHEIRSTYNFRNGLDDLGGFVRWTNRALADAQGASDDIIFADEETA